MPRGDGTGPRGMGPGTGRGMGRGRNRGQGRSQGLGPGGKCVCPACGAIISHQSGKPCSTLSCPKCGAKMRRQ